MYPIVCRIHKEHCEECGMCRNFDREVTKELSSYKPPPSSHPTVVVVQVKEWISGLFFEDET